MNETTADEDEQAAYGNDLLDLGFTHQKLKAAACSVFCPSVENFSRAPAGSTPASSQR